MKTKFLILVLVFLSITGLAQNTYEFYGKLGASNQHIVYSNINVETLNSYSYSPSFGIGGLYVMSFKDNRYRLKTGVEVNSVATKIGLKKDVPTYVDYEFEEVVNTVVVGVLPIRFSYSFEKWMYFNLGLDNKFLLKKTGYNENSFVLGCNAGVDFLVKDNYLIGATYNRDLTPLRAFANSSSFYSDQISLKLTYILK